MAESANTIMIVDDELFFRGLLRDILTAEGFTVVGEATDGQEALEKYKTHRPALLIMDIFMPEKNGIDATKEIVAFDSGANIIICSGVGYDDDIDAAYRAGAKDVIFKPFYPAEVIETVRKILC
jgi:two-component system chemotaxis response regulator CheY